MYVCIMSDKKEHLKRGPKEKAVKCVKPSVSMLPAVKELLVAEYGSLPKAIVYLYELTLLTVNKKKDENNLK